MGRVKEGNEWKDTETVVRRSRKGNLVLWINGSPAVYKPREAQSLSNRLLEVLDHESEEGS